MKILKSPVVTVSVEFDYDELCGLLKVLGKLSISVMTGEFGLSQEQAHAAEQVYMSLSDFVPSEDR